MPVFGSLSAAQDFARCGISLFHHMGIIDVLSFGSEAGEIKKLQELADQAGTETEEQSDLIRKVSEAALPTHRHWLLPEKILFLYRPTISLRLST